MTETRKYLISDNMRANFEAMISHVFWVISKMQDGMLDSYVMFGKTMTKDELYELKNELFSYTPHLQTCEMTEEQYKRVLEISREMAWQRYVMSIALDLETDEANKKLMS